MFCYVKNITRLYDSLSDKTKQYAQDLSPALLNNLFLVCYLILLKETVNLNKLKNHVGVMLEQKTTQTDSHYRRLTRFFHHPISKRKLWKWLIAWLIDYVQHWDGRSLTCYLDGTSWQFGKTHIHLLVLSLVYRGVSLPLYWVNLAKKGQSSQREGIRLIQQANKLFPLKGMCILADREYVGKNRFKFLTDNEIQFIIRLTKEDYKHEISQGRRRYSSLLKSAMKGRLCGQWFDLEQHRYQFVALHHDDVHHTSDPLVLLISNTTWSHGLLAKRYGIRCFMECLFRHLKSNGFDIEELGMTSLPKIRLLVVVYIIC